MNLKDTMFSFSTANSIREWDVRLENLSTFFVESQTPAWGHPEAKEGAVSLATELVLATIV